MSTTEEAAAVVAKSSHIALDKKHKCIVNRWSDYSASESVSKTWQPPAVPRHRSKPVSSYYDWLAPGKIPSEQYLLTYEKLVMIYACRPPETPVRVLESHDFSNATGCWSNSGRYFYLQHAGRVDVYGGPDLSIVATLEQAGSDLTTHFSPSEHYMVTCSIPPNVGGAAQQPLIRVWDLYLQMPMTTLPPAAQPFVSQLWSHDDAYIAFLVDGQIHILSSATCAPIAGSPVGATSGTISHAQWSPSECRIAYVIPDHEGIPARAVLLSVPDLVEIAQKNIFGLTRCDMQWQSDGDYLAIKANPSKAKKTATNALEVFRIREPGVPFEAIKMDQIIQAFAWEPHGKRIAILHSPIDGTAQRWTVSFYTLEGIQATLVLKLENRAVNMLVWSPRGGQIALASLPGGAFSFVFLDMSVGNLEKLPQQPPKEFVHANATDCCWDPTGRYFVSYTSALKERGENGWMLWSAAGRELISELRNDRLLQFIWRPRPSGLVTAQNEAEIRRDWQQIVARFKAQDRAKALALRKLSEAHHKELRTEFYRIEEKLKREWEIHAEERRLMRHGYNSEEELAWVVVGD